MKGALPSHRVTPDCLSLPADVESYTSPTTINQPYASLENLETSKVRSILASNFFDLVVIGAGPAALTLVARILESRPAALYTDQEHLYLHWLKRKHNPPLIRTRKMGSGGDRVAFSSLPQVQVRNVDFGRCESRLRILVIDKLGGGWMESWDRQFSSFDIKRKSP